MQREEERSEEGMRDLINKIKHKENKNERKGMKHETSERNKEAKQESREMT